jgi:hypothetical protein
MADDFKYDVFLSHSSKDKDIVRDVAERLKADGLRVWFDEWILKPGDSLPKKLDDGLEESRVLVLFMSANAFGSDWAQLEAGAFRFRDPLNKELRFIPVRLDAAPIKGALAQFLYVDWLPEKREQEYAKLLKACQLETCRPIEETLNVKSHDEGEDDKPRLPTESMETSEETEGHAEGEDDKPVNPQRVKSTLKIYRAMCSAEHLHTRLSSLIRSSLVEIFLGKPFDIDAKLIVEFHTALKNFSRLFNSYQDRLDLPITKAVTVFFDSLLVAGCNIRATAATRKWIEQTIYYQFSPLSWLQNYSFSFEYAFRKLHSAFDESLFLAGAFGWASDSSELAGPPQVRQNPVGGGKALITVPDFIHAYEEILEAMPKDCLLSRDEILEMARKRTPFHIEIINSSRGAVQFGFTSLKSIVPQFSATQLKAITAGISYVLRKHYQVAKRNHSEIRH